MVVVPRKTIETELYSLGLTPRKVLYAYQENGFITTELFDEYADEIRFPFIEETREEMQYDGAAIVILDGCSCHNGDGFLDGCTYHGVYPVFLPPHSSDQIQPLDLGIFARQKAEASNARPPEGLNPQTTQLAKMITGYRKATTEVNVVSAFRRAGICAKWSEYHQAMIVEIDRERAKAVRAWGLCKKRISLDTDE
jgi:hypothetical protein